MTAETRIVVIGGGGAGLSAAAAAAEMGADVIVLEKRGALGDKAIAGLYAAGSDTGGWESDTYNVVLSGSTLGFAINSGRIAGENAARFVSQAKR